MPSKAKHKVSGGDKDFATKNTMNPPTPGGGERGNQTREPQEQDTSQRVGQYGGEGEPPLMKK